ncbi:fatty acyl-AMP ligase [Eleftheria terrae]|uniref:fatty acyl-AMP ligase n=1 Tax=Eleftheria terrae TaxID=1597781 RepID=UPI00263A9F1D|nr:fatty acyl-AMP ligase [Eleftheria terrae]WKB55877.1 fatty acyl-AMP ligase [Eleftheria terrae]
MQAVQDALARCRSFETPAAPAPARHFAEVLQFRAATTPQEFAYALLGFGQRPDLVMSYADMHRRALAIAARLLAHGRVGDPVLLVFPSAHGFIEAFFGCLYAGRVAVPALPPRIERERRRLLGIVADCRPAAVLCGSADLAPLCQELMAAGHGGLPCVAVEEIPDDGSEPALPRIDAQALAFLQYTSGSTAVPKGVMVGHDNLLHNEGLLRRYFGADQERWMMVSWLPHYHDMGLMAGILLPLFAGRPGVFFSPQDFLQQPTRWLRALSTFGGTCSGAANFGYELCVRRAPRMNVAELDLSGWRYAFNGAEPVREDTMRRFAEVFAPAGFRYEHFAPGYGLAEATLLTTSKFPGEAPRVRELDAAALAEGRFLPATGGGRTVALASVGQVGPSGQQLRIIDPGSGQALPPLQVGEICLAGGSVCRGYFGQDALSEDIFHAYRSPELPGGLLRTGDLGCVDQDGHLFITGRLKDVIIHNGVNHYPQDIEAAVEDACEQVRPGRLAAFAVEQASGSEVLLVFEALPGLDFATVAPALIDHVWSTCQLKLDGLLCVKKGQIPLTSSGKIQRSACRRLLLGGEFSVLALHGSEAMQARWRHLLLPAAGDGVEAAGVPLAAI